MNQYKISEFNQSRIEHFNGNFSNFRNVVFYLDSKLSKYEFIVEHLIWFLQCMYFYSQEDKKEYDPGENEYSYIEDLSIFIRRNPSLFSKTVYGKKYKYLKCKLPLSKKYIILRCYKESFYGIFDFKKLESDDIIFDMDKNIENYIEEYNLFFELANKYIEDNGIKENQDKIKCKQHHFFDRQKEFDNLREEYLGLGILNLAKSYKKTKNYKHLSFILEILYHYFAHFYGVHEEGKSVEYHTEKMIDLMKNLDPSMLINISDYDKRFKNYKYNGRLDIWLPWSRQHIWIEEQWTKETFKWNGELVPEFMLKSVAQEINEMQYLI